MKIRKYIVMISLLSYCLVAYATDRALPAGFVYLKDIDPTIQQDIRYASSHNFIGRPVTGYTTNQCILTKPAALALSQVQHALQPLHLSLKVYDCYRPQRAVNDFINWSQQPEDQTMKMEFYPRVNKSDLFRLGYIAAQSGHSRGSTVDLTLVPIPTPAQQTYSPKQPLVSCYAPYQQRFRDNSIDMGTGYDCMDVLSHNNATGISKIAKHHRLLLKTLMKKSGFIPYQKEWWHFTLRNEPYPDKYFDFLGSS